MEQAINQLLMSFGIIQDEMLRSYLETIFDPGNPIPSSLSPIFANINANIRAYSMEIKSIVLVDERTNKRLIFHGLVNSDEDLVSKLNGSRYDEVETKAFAVILSKLLQTRYLNSREILEEVRATASLTAVSPAKMEAALLMFQEDKWLKRNDKNLWEIGPRAYLELPQYMQELLSDPDDMEGGITAEDFPQLIVY